MNPSRVANTLRLIAAKIDSSAKPSRKLVAEDLKWLLKSVKVAGRSDILNAVDAAFDKHGIYPPNMKSIGSNTYEGEIDTGWVLTVKDDPKGMRILLNGQPFNSLNDLVEGFKNKDLSGSPQKPSDLVKLVKGPSGDMVLKYDSFYIEYEDPLSSEYPFVVAYTSWNPGNNEDPSITIQPFSDKEDLDNWKLGNFSDDQSYWEDPEDADEILGSLKMIGTGSLLGNSYCNLITCHMTSDDWKKIVKERKTKQNLVSRQRRLVIKLQCGRIKFRSDPKIQLELSRVVALCHKVSEKVHLRLQDELVKSIMSM